MTLYFSERTKKDQGMEAPALIQALLRSTAVKEKTHVLDLVARLCGLCTAASSLMEVQSSFQMESFTDSPTVGLREPLRK